MKKVILILLSLIAFSIFGFFVYFYYIGPQKEFIKLELQNCFNKAMSPMNEMLAANGNESKNWVEATLETQNEELQRCSYDILFFSKGERNTIRLNLSIQIDEQKKKVDRYIEKINTAEAVRQQALESQQRAREQDLRTQEACSNMKSEKKNYDSCVDTERKKNNSYYSSADYLNFSFDFFGENQGDLDKDVCLRKYNFQRFGVDNMLCIIRSY